MDVLIQYDSILLDNYTYAIYHFLAGMCKKDFLL